MWAGGAGIRSEHPRPSLGTVRCCGCSQWGMIEGSLHTEPGCKRGEHALWVLGGGGICVTVCEEQCFCVPCPLSSSTHRGIPRVMRAVHPLKHTGLGINEPRNVGFGREMPPLDRQLDAKGALGCKSLAAGNRVF